MSNYKDKKKQKATQRAWYLANQEKQKAYSLNYRKENLEELREKDKGRYAADPDKFKNKSKDWVKSNPIKRAEVARRHQLKNQGWTVERFDASLLTQGGLCDICGVVLTCPEEDLIATRASADHEHSDPPQARGILCSICNSGLGFFKDSPALLEAAAAYLRKWGKT